MDVIQLLYFVFPDKEVPSLYETSGLGMVPHMTLYPGEGLCKE